MVDVLIAELRRSDAGRLEVNSFEMEWSASDLVRILAALCGNTVVKSLNLSSCGLHGEEAVLDGLAAMLSVNTHLEELILQRNRLTAAQVMELAEALARNPRMCLRELDLYCNFVNDACAEALLDVCASSPTLRYLDLMLNRVTSAGAPGIVAAARHTSLEALGLDNKVFKKDPSLKLHLFATLAANKTRNTVAFAAALSVADAKAETKAAREMLEDLERKLEEEVERKLEEVHVGASRVEPKTEDPELAADDANHVDDTDNATSKR